MKAKSTKLTVQHREKKEDEDAGRCNREDRHFCCFCFLQKKKKKIEKSVIENMET